ncbi:MAG: DUF4147 domain-containing protein [Thermoflexales bacterium]|nr:DUF4147 domain-containing protein [Thermoflexales bacterium]MCS7324222.1 DUF4147 domain-containing protein [Thermoflexales bacterium]MCX7939282.1 DUF4147 domain-containing protein [Thermoflexales bacterium]MDW8054744.1 DUF4147 domain-containing protein [Anaerolineae bacterium]MDW8292547.1 DUF4147 domain-containing protein [Anaerolineae bacterium]
MSVAWSSIVETLVRAALDAVVPEAAVRRHVRCEGEMLVVGEQRYALHDFDDVRLVAAGKAAVPMARAIVALLGNRLSHVVVVTKHGHGAPVSWEGGTAHVIEAGHPIPDEHSMRAGEAVIDALQGCTSHTLVIACVSGGASALLVAPQPGITLRTLQAVNEALLRSGANIREINAVRARLDRLKGGGLVALAQPATVVALILSDVVGDPLDVIASGLTYHPAAHNVLVGNNAQACIAAANAARALGFAAEVVTTQLTGEAREVGRAIAEAICAAPARTALIYGGETTVTLRGDGKGGRNQELALAAGQVFAALRSRDDVCLCALGTDGTDGPTDAAGAWVTPAVMWAARALGLDADAHLARNDSYTFFERAGALIRTGPTGTNVADVVIALRA